MGGPIIIPSDFIGHRIGTIFQGSVHNFCDHPVTGPVMIREGRIIRSGKQFHFRIHLTQRRCIRRLIRRETRDAYLCPFWELKQGPSQFILIALIDHCPLLVITIILFRYGENRISCGNDVCFFAVGPSSAAKEICNKKAKYPHTTLLEITPDDRHMLVDDLLIDAV